MSDHHLIDRADANKTMVHWLTTMPRRMLMTDAGRTLCGRYRAIDWKGDYKSGLDPLERPNTNMPKKPRKNAAPRKTARAPRKTAGSMGTASGTSSAVGVGSLTVTADVTMAQESGVATTVILGFPPEAEPFRTAINRHAKEILSLLESNPEEMHLIEAELARRVRSKKHGNMIAALGYDRDTFPTVAAAASLLNRDARTVLELVNIDRALPWSLKSIHQNLEDTAKLFRAIAAVLDGFGKMTVALTKIVLALTALVAAVVGLLAALGVL